MKNSFLFTIGLLCCGMLVAQQNGNKPFLTQPITGSFASAKVRTSGGNIIINGTSDGSTRVEMYVQGNNGRQKLSEDELKTRLDELYDVEIGVKDNQLNAIAKPKGKMKEWKKALSISFTVFVPAKTGTDLATSGGNVQLSGLNGKQDFSTSGGNLQLENISGSIHGRTSGGNINLKDCSDDIDLRTSGGNIEAKGCEGKIELHTSGGSIYLKDMKGDITSSTSGGNVEGKTISGELTANTSGGNIRFDELACSLETSTSGGNIHVSMQELGKYIRIRNSSGNVDLDLPKGKGLDLELTASRVKTDHLENFSGRLKEDEISGTLNGGGILVKVKAGSGQIHLGLK